MSIAIFIVIFLLIAWIVVSPFFKSGKNDFAIVLDSVPDSQRVLQRRRSELMLTLKELDFDFETGKLSPDDYKTLRVKYEQEAIEILKQIDAEKDLWDRFQKKLDQTMEKT